MRMIEVSMGDFIDRHSILRIKAEEGLNVKKEIKQYDKGADANQGYEYFLNILTSINRQLWILEDRKRKGVKRYTEEESDVAFLITELNDLRFRAKKAADKYFMSTITEEKSH